MSDKANDPIAKALARRGIHDPGKYLDALENIPTEAVAVIRRAAFEAGARAMRELCVRRLGRAGLSGSYYQDIVRSLPLQTPKGDE